MLLGWVAEDKFISGVRKSVKIIPVGGWQRRGPCPPLKRTQIKTEIFTLEKFELSSLRSFLSYQF